MYCHVPPHEKKTRQVKDKSEEADNQPYQPYPSIVVNHTTVCKTLVFGVIVYFSFYISGSHSHRQESYILVNIYETINKQNMAQPPTVLVPEFKVITIKSGTQFSVGSFCIKRFNYLCCRVVG